MGLQIYITFNFIWLILNANVITEMGLKLSTENLPRISNSVINNLAVTFFLYVFMAKLFLMEI